MRAGALSDAQVGAYLKEHFVSTWKRVSTFTAVQQNGKTVARLGGNVAVYFCTPEREVIHAIAGPVGKEKFLADAKWAVETWKAAREKAGDDREALAKAIAEAHRAASPNRPTSSGRWVNKSGTLGVYELDAPTILRESLDVFRVESYNTLKPFVPAPPQEAPKPETPKKAEKGPETMEYRSAVPQAALLQCEPAQPQTLLLNRQDPQDQAKRTLTLAVAGGGRNMHRFLADRGLPKLDDITRDVFQGLLGQRLTEQPVRIQEMLPANVMRSRATLAAPVEDQTAKIRELQKQVQELKKQIEELKAASQKRPTY